MAKHRVILGLAAVAPNVPLTSDAPNLIGLSGVTLAMAMAPALEAFTKGVVIHFGILIGVGFDVSIAFLELSNEVKYFRSLIGLRHFVPSLRVPQ